ncbi:MAG: GxxExxY protein [candidate division WOR-3 bacterium]|nr:MAG: GxxExxY protein [candidate division WOR-3 bacterium]
MPKYEKWLQDVVDAAEEVMKGLGNIEYKEAVYEEALCHEMRIRGIRYERQRNFELMYKGYTVGSGRADFVINPFWATKKAVDEHVMEIKAVKDIKKVHKRQAVVYMISLEIEKGAVMSFSHEKGVLVEPVELPVPKKLIRDVCFAKPTKPRNTKKCLEKAVQNVHHYFGPDFFYNDALTEMTYTNAIGVEMLLAGVDFATADYPILYKHQRVDSLPIPFLFPDGSGMTSKFYKNEEEIDEYKDYYKYYKKKFNIKKLYLALLPVKEADQVVFIEL